MNIKIVTDSTSDLSAELARELGITIVPAYVHFGEETFRDGVDINQDEFYARLENGSAWPATEPAAPEDFAAVYDSLSGDADAIISIHISSNLSATCNSARQGIKLSKASCPIEVIDSRLVTMALGLLVIAATDIATKGMSLQQVVDTIKGMIPDIRILGYLETLKYLVQGGRVGKARALLRSMFSVQPLLTMKDGEIEAAGHVRNREGGIDHLLKFIEESGDIQELAIVYSTTPEEVRPLLERAAALLPGKQIRTARLGPTLGVHAGPSILFVALREQGSA